MRIRRIYYPMTVSSSIISEGNANTQYYDTTLNQYLPDLSITPFVFKLTASKIEGKTGDAQEVTEFIDTSFYELVEGIWKQLSSTSTIVLDASKGSMTIKSNLQVGSTRTFRIDAKIADSRKEGKYVLVTQQFQIFCKPMSEDALTLNAEYPDGRRMNVLGKLPEYRLQAIMRKGINPLNNVWYRWYRVNGNVETEITSANAGVLTGYDGPTLKVPYYGEVGTKRCEYKAVAHPQEDLTGINQISKSMIYEGFNALGDLPISEKGEDADGVYYRIDLAEWHVATSVHDKDTFNGLIKYKSNQRYILSVKGKTSGASAYFIIRYTDGTEDKTLLNSRTLTTIQFITAKNKTINYICGSYGNGGYFYIYDIQLMEYYGENLIPDSIPNEKKGQLTPTENYFFFLTPYYSSLEKLGLSVGDKITASFDMRNDTGYKLYGSIAFITDADTKYITGEIQSSGTRAIISGIIPTGAKSIGLFFAANPTPTSAITVYVSKVKLERGETATPYNPSITDTKFIPAIADGLTPKPAFSNKDLNVRMALSKIYPQPINKELWVTSNGDIPIDVNMIEGECLLQSNVGTLVNPEYDYSFIWKYRPSSTGIWKEWARGRRILKPYTEDMDIECVITPGLDKAKYAACFDGVDDYLSSSKDISIDEGMTILVEFVNISKPSWRDLFKIVSTKTDKSFVCYISNGILRFEYVIGKVLYLFKTGISIDSNRRYILNVSSFNIQEVSFTLNGKDYLFNNPIIDIPNAQTKGIYIGASDAGGGIYYGSIMQITVKNENNLILNFDFQPVNGDRSAMLKNKNADGTINETNPVTLTAQNIDNLNELNPEEAFFKPI